MDSAQGLETDSQQGSSYGTMDKLPDLSHPSGQLDLENLDASLTPQGRESNQGMAWFQTDL